VRTLVAELNFWLAGVHVIVLELGLPSSEHTNIRNRVRRLEALNYGAGHAVVQPGVDAQLRMSLSNPEIRV